MVNRRSVIRAIAAGAASIGAARAFAQDDKATVTVLVGAATTMDATARLISELLREALGRPVITVSKLGAGGRVALNELRRSPPDGRTLMFSTSSPFAIYPNIYTKLDYDPVADFTPIGGVCAFDVGLATGPSVAATDLKAWSSGRAPPSLARPCMARRPATDRRRTSPASACRWQPTCP
jgi:tripartite-type tricarboxylate transporter receptor subunit TctC